MEMRNQYFLKMSGSISIGKQREFQQTITFIFNQLPSACVSRHLALDMNVSNLYHIYSIWQSEESLLAFKMSSEFELLKGTFQTLGVYNDTLAGRWASIQLFDLYHYEV
jgi:hypothetical protein